MRRRLVAILACALVGCVNHDAKTDVKQDVVAHDLAVELEGARDEAGAPVEPAGDEQGAADDAEEGRSDAALANAEDAATELLAQDRPSGELDDDLEFVYRQCVHEMDSRRPRLTEAAQQRTKQIIAHMAKRMRMSAGFRKLLRLVALREASYQSGLVHRLQPDLQGSLSAWRKMSKRYEGNPYADDASLWQTYGLFGMNSNYFTMLWDRQGDPRVLCDPIIDVVVYRRAAIRALRKLGGTIRCRNAKGETYDYRTTATWATIHRAVNGGKLCPSKREERAAIMRKYFAARANRIGLDPDQPVSAKMLGEEPEKGLDGEAWESQEEMVMGLWAEFEAELADEVKPS